MPYPDELESATGLILQYKKEKERELLRKKKYNKYNNNKDNNNNSINNNHGDDGKTNDKIETVGAIVEQDNNKRTMTRLLVVINVGYVADETLFDPEMDQKRVLQRM